MSGLSDAAMRRLRAQLGTPAVIAGRYDVGAELGRGGMGVVHRATDRVLGRDVAVKLLAVEVPAEQFAEHMRREFTLLARLEHPGIVPIYDAGVLEDGRVYYVMRLVEGKRLDEFATSGVSRGELLRVVLRIAEAVAFAHGHGVAHCDLKPANVMIGPYGEVLVLDWGIARVLAAFDGRTDTGRVAGTPGYMAPEQEIDFSLAGDARVDVYSLGIILGELHEIHAEPIPKPLLSIAGKATSRAPAARYATMAEFAADIRRWLDGERVLAHREGVLERAGRFVRRHQVALLLLLTYVVVRTFILLWRGV
jgi:eukaryotic-like serine/threonine-protein kinase